MKCTMFKDGEKCGNETGQPCPYEWTKHQTFSPIVVRAFFDRLVNEETLNKLDAFVCPECMPEWKDHTKASNAANRAVKTRKEKQVERVAP